MICDITTFKDIVDLALTSVLTIATVLLAIYTWKLVDETRKMRKEQIRPNISVYFEHAETDPTLIFIVVENNGHGTAYNVKFHIKKDFNDYQGDDGSGKVGYMGIFKHGMKYCPPGFIKKYFILETVNNYEEKIKDEIHFSATYSDTFNTYIEEVFKIAVNEMSNWSTISPSPTHIGRIAGSLNEISRYLEKKG